MDKLPKTNRVCAFLESDCGRHSNCIVLMQFLVKAVTIISIQILRAFFFFLSQWAPSSFRAAPRQGHMDRLKRMYGYITKMKHGAIRFRTDIPDYTAIPIPEHSWIKTVYGEAREEIPHNAPKPLGMPLLMTTYVDANLCHDMTTGKSVTSVLHFYNQTPIDFYTRKQGTVETAWFPGSLDVGCHIHISGLFGCSETTSIFGCDIHFWMSTSKTGF